ncbi:hypothetical protein SGPA1_50500 [Streptomyces misionensis JCM 4497]
MGDPSATHITPRSPASRRKIGVVSEDYISYRLVMLLG